MDGKTPSESAIVMRNMLMPPHANHHGIAFGGTILSWIDIAAAMAAEKHAENAVVTASIDNVSFHKPIFISDHVILNATVIYTGRTSIEVEVDVFAENPTQGRKVKATSAHVTLVSITDNGGLKSVPKLSLQTDAEKAKFEEAKLRAQVRKERKKKAEENA